MSTVAKSILNVTAYQRRWADNVAKRFDRHFDDRDMVLGEALRLAEQRSDDYYPAVVSYDAALSQLSSDVLTGLQITGTNFVADTVKASGISDEDSATKEITWTRIVPGDEDITLTIATSGVANHTVTAAWNPTTKVLTVTRGTLATAAEVETAIPLDAAAKFIVSADATGDGTGVPSAGSITLTGGKGALPVLHVGATAVDGSAAGNGITAWTDTTITFNVDASGYTDGTTKLLRLWVDDVLVLDAPLIVGNPSGTPSFTDVAVTPDATANGTGVVATSEQLQVRTLLLTLTNTPVVLADNAGVMAYGSLKVADLPEGYIGFLGAVADLALTKSSAGVNNDWDGDIALGTAAANNTATLTGTEQDLIPTTPTPQASAGATTGDMASTSTEAFKVFDGHATAKDVYLNVLVDDADHDVTGTACNIIVNGTIKLTYVVLGDN